MFLTAIDTAREKRKWWLPTGYSLTTVRMHFYVVCSWKSTFIADTQQCTSTTAFYYKGLFPRLRGGGSYSVELNHYCCQLTIFRARKNGIVLGE